MKAHELNNKEMRMKEIDNKELKRLNKAVDDSIKERTEWLDIKMIEYSELKIGDEAYDTNTLKPIGKITEIYRYHRNHAPLYDTSIDVKYQVDWRPIDGFLFNKNRVNLELKHRIKELNRIKSKEEIEMEEKMKRPEFWKEMYLNGHP